MAKTYAQFFQLFKETQYSSNTLPLMKLSALNKSVNFLEVPSQHGQTFNSTPQIMVQRLKRVKAIDSPVDLTVSSKFGTNFIAQLDNASYLDWDTITTQRSKLRQIAIVQPRNAEFDIDDVNDAFGRAISFQTENTLFAAEEAALTKVWGAALPGSAAPFDLSNIGSMTDQERRALVDQIFLGVFQIQHLVDDYKAYSSNVIGIVHPIVAYCFEILHGTQYRYAQSDEAFETGAAAKSFEYNGVTFYVSPLLNFLPGSATGTAAGAIIMDAEAYANSGFGSAESIIPFNETLLGDVVVGHKYAYLDIVLDSKRIIKYEVKLPASNPISTPVNA